MMKNKKNAPVIWFVLILMFFATGCACMSEKRVRDIARDEFRACEQEMIAEWRKKLEPVYKDMSIKYNKNPKTLLELMVPFFDLVDKTGGK